MCGIAGYARPGSPADVAPAVLEAMAQTLWRRGPDEGGFYRDDHCGLAIRRLSVMDPQAGHQPVHDEAGRYQVVYNGEIYNFTEIRDTLRARGHRFVSDADTEVIPHAWEEEGPACVSRFNGMFGFAVWDRLEKRLFLCRDRMGIKPLHYCVVDGTLVFGSELKALLAFPGVSRDIDPIAFEQYLTYDYVPAPRTIFRHIKKLMPGEMLQFDAAGLKVSTWAPLPAGPDGDPFDMETAAETLRSLLRDSVRRMLVADVPVGLFLSGGIDSSTLVALASQLKPGGVETFSIGFEDPSFDESQHARRVAEFYGTRHHEEKLHARDVATLIPEVLGAMDEPMADASIVPTYLLARLCRRHVTVALSGEGGDELFGGYPTYAAAALAHTVARLPRPLVGAVRSTVNRLPVSTANLSLDFKLKRFFGYLQEAPGPRHILWMGSFGPQQKAPLLLHPQASETDLWAPLAGLAADAMHPVDLAMQLDQRLYLADDLLVKLDRASMAVSLEGRVPFLDDAVVAFARRLPRAARVQGQTTKVLLKKAVGPLLPPGIATRPKKGFGIPVARWIQGELKPLLLDLLSPARVGQWDLVRAPQVAQLVAEHQAGRHDHRKLLWNLMVFSLWWEAWARP